MPTVPLYVVPAVANAWHRVRSPGGYETWSFDVEDRDSPGTRVVVSFSEGSPFDPGYLRRHMAYLKNPTRVRPALPSEFPCVEITAFERDQVVAHAATRYDSAAFSASEQTLDVRIGSGNRIHASDDRAYQVQVEAESKKGASIRAELTFTSCASPPAERELMTRALSGGLHRWLIAAPWCEVRGAVSLSGSGIKGPHSGREIRLTGIGYHDHLYGTGPYGPGVRCWMQGRLLLEDRTVAFCHTRSADSNMPDETQVVEIARGETSQFAELPKPQANIEGSQRARFGLTYPGRIAGEHMPTLTEPRVIGSSLFSTRVRYRAHWRNQAGTAVCTVADPRRLCWPIVGRLIEANVTKK